MGFSYGRADLKTNLYLVQNPPGIVAHNVRVVVVVVVIRHDQPCNVSATTRAALVIFL